jgi:hypothetical protein
MQQQVAGCQASVVAHARRDVEVAVAAARPKDRLALGSR